jgi:hypothetical protein
VSKSSKVGLGAVGWLLLWIGVAYVTTEIQNPDWSVRRKDRAHEFYGELAGAGSVGLGVWAFALRKRGE